jgi:L-threonylcarbamoyladenylate synthase
MPVAAPSANSSGRPSPTTAEAVADDLGNAPAVLLDGGSTALGVESTVVDAVSETLTLLRPGGLPLEELEAVAGKVLLPETAQLLAHSPGTRHRHYAPTLPLFLWEEDGRVWTEVAALAQPEEIGYVGLREPPFPCGAMRRFAHVDAYATGLFAALRDLEKCDLRLLVADMPSSFRIGRALRDRLHRAAQRP